MKKILLLLVLSGTLYADNTNTDGDKIVSVPQKYVSSEGLSHQAEQLGKWSGIGKEIGDATKQGLTAVLDTADKFGSTKVGTFVMVMIAWKIMAKDVIGIVLGIPIFTVLLYVWFWLVKRFFVGFRILERKEGHTKFYVDHAPYQFSSDEARAGLASVLGIVGTLLVIGLIVVVFV